MTSGSATIPRSDGRTSSPASGSSARRTQPATPSTSAAVGEAAAARMAELEQQAAELGLDVFGGPLADAQAPEPEAEL